MLVQPPKSVRQNVKNYFAGTKPITVPRAVGQTLGNASPLLVPILRAPSTAYSYNPKEEAEAVDDVWAAGEQIALVSAVQARNSARFTVLGSVDVLQDKWFTSKTGNEEFAQQITSWTFKETGVVKAGVLQHYLKETGGAKGGILNASKFSEEEINPTIYRIKTDVVSL